MYTPSSLYDKNYLKMKNKAEVSEDIDVLSLGRKKDAEQMHCQSVFPNNHILLWDMKNRYDLKEQNDSFANLVHTEGTKEQAVLNFINHTPAYHIVASILCNRYPFGHHECYLFKEFWLGNTYRTDYVLIGKGSGGYEVVLIEFEKPDGYITLRTGYWGCAFRNGEYQVRDWKSWLEGNYEEFADALRLVAKDGIIPSELEKYDSSRFHYVVVAGLRDDFDDVTYRERRKKMQESDIALLHHDNLIDNSNTLLSRETF